MQESRLCNQAEFQPQSSSKKLAVIIAVAPMIRKSKFINFGSLKSKSHMQQKNPIGVAIELIPRLLASKFACRTAIPPKVQQKFPLLIQPIGHAL